MKKRYFYVVASFMRKDIAKIADPATIQFDNYFEISKEDYEAFNKAKNLVKVNK